MVDYTADLQRTAKWGAYFAETWVNDSPVRIHSAQIGNDGAPMWHPEFERWLTMEEGRKGDRRPEEKLRTAKVMRRLRRAAIREYEVLFRVLIMHEPIVATPKDAIACYLKTNMDILAIGNWVLTRAQSSASQQ